MSDTTEDTEVQQMTPGQLLAALASRCREAPPYEPGPDPDDLREDRYLPPVVAELTMRELRNLACETRTIREVLAIAES